MLKITIREHSSNATFELDGKDITSKLLVTKLEVDPILPNSQVVVRLTVIPDTLEILAKDLEVKLVDGS